MLDKKKIMYKLSGNKNFSTNVLKPFSFLAVEFLNDFSNELRKQKKIFSYPDLVYLMFWCRKKKIENLAKNYENNELRLGRGLIFHICPSNVPTNFIYSFFFGLLSGNSNIVKLPKKNFKERNIILSILRLLFNRKKYVNLKKIKLFC